jgi:hypothetical protein
MSKITKEIRPVASKYTAVGGNVVDTWCTRLTRMDGCELGIKLAFIEGAIIRRMAPVNAMANKNFLMIDPI